MQPNSKLVRNVYLTDDDQDDCMFFWEALHELNDSVKLTIINDGAKLMEKLRVEEPVVPEIIFLDLNMPRKNGLECLTELGAAHRFNNTSIIIFSTNSNLDIVEESFKCDANFYICKPHSFTLFKKTIEHVLSFEPMQLLQQPPRDNFVISMA